MELRELRWATLACRDLPLLPAFATAVLFFSGAVTLFYTRYLVAPQTLPSGDGARAAR